MQLRRADRKTVLTALFLLGCLAVSGYYLFAGYGAYLDADMSSELALARHLADSKTLISPQWRYSTEIRVLNTQLVFTPLMALLGADWQLVRVLGCLILLGLMAASSVFCARMLGARTHFALLFAGVSVLPLSVVYAQMIVIGAYYVPHAILTNLTIGLTASLMDKKHQGLKLAALLVLSAVMGASSIRYLLCAAIPSAAAGAWMALFPAKEKTTCAERRLLTASFASAALCGAGYIVGQKVLGRLYMSDGARYSGSRLMSLTNENIFDLLDRSLDGLIKLTGYLEGKIMLSVQGLLSIGVLGMLALAVLLCLRGIKAGREEGSPAQRYGVLALVFSAGAALFTFVFVEGLYLNRYWLPVMTLGGSVMAMCLSREKRAALRLIGAAVFACVVLGLSAVQIRDSMRSPEIDATDWRNAQLVRESGIALGYATFWNANVMTELTDGEAEVVAMSIESNAQGQGYPQLGMWLEIERDTQMTRPDEPVFLLLGGDEVQKMAQFLQESGAQEKALAGNGLHMYVLERQSDFFGAMEKLRDAQ